VKPVTETEWLETGDPRRLLKHLHGKVSTRKRRLFSVACCRRVRHLFDDRRSQDAIEVVERYAERRANGQELAVAAAGAAQANSQHDAMAVGAVPAKTNVFPGRFWAARAAWWATNAHANVAAWKAARESSFAASMALASSDPSVSTADALRCERQSQCQLLRDIFGNPFCPLPPRPEAVAPLAERIYAGEWELMPIFGECLQEQGYWSEGEHCLDPNNEHVKGCWVVDWVTGRE
jgi:hypothetical protein